MFNQVISKRLNDEVRGTSSTGPELEKAMVLVTWSKFIFDMSWVTAAELFRLEVLANPLKKLLSLPLSNPDKLSSLFQISLVVVTFDIFIIRST